MSWKMKFWKVFEGVIIPITLVCVVALAVFVFGSIIADIRESKNIKYDGRFVVLSRFALEGGGTGVLMRDTTNHTEYIVVNRCGIAETYPTIEEK